MPTRFQTAAEIRSSLIDAGVDARDASALASRAKPYVWLEPTIVDDDAEIPIGATKIGGAPDLPAGVSWPWRSAYPDHAERVAEVRAGVARLSPANMEAAKQETLDEFRLIAPELFQSIEEAYAKIDFSAIRLDDIAEQAERSALPAPLAFIAQVDLGEARRAGAIDPDIPRAGRLLFFYDIDQMPGGYKPGDITGARITLDMTPAAGLRRTPPPPELAPVLQAMSIRPQRCMLYGALSPPFYGSPDWTACELREKADEDMRVWWHDVTGEEHDHRVGGHPLQIQNDMQTECALVSQGLDLGTPGAWTSPAAERFKADAASWVLLLQIASDKRAGMMWGDMGNLYVWIHRDALRRRRFEEARVIFQCY